MIVYQDKNESAQIPTTLGHNVPIVRIKANKMVCTNYVYDGFNFQIKSLLKVSVHCPKNIDYMKTIAKDIPIDFFDQNRINHCPHILSSGIAVLGF